MAVGDEKILVAVVVVVEEFGAPGEELKALQPHPRIEREIGEKLPSVVVIQGVRLLLN